MAVEKGKVLTAIESKFKGKSLSKNFKDKIATDFAAKIETDEDIDAYIADREVIFLEASAEADRRATEAAAKAKKEAAEAVTGPKPEDPPKEDAPALPPDTPEWMKTFIQNQQKQIDTLTQTVTGFQAQQQAKSIAERFKGHESLKGIPEIFFEGRIPTKEEDFDAAVTNLKGIYDKFAQDYKLEQAGSHTPPGAKPKPSGSKEATKEELDAVMNNL